MLFLDGREIEIGTDLELDASDKGYEQLLVRGLEFTSREKGDYHEETLAHLDALAVHLKTLAS